MIYFEDNTTTAAVYAIYVATNKHRSVLQVQPSAKREGFATVPGVSWSDVGALASVREELGLSILEPIAYPEVSCSMPSLAVFYVCARRYVLYTLRGVWACVVGAIH